jgi:hypothetical protein
MFKAESSESVPTYLDRWFQMSGHMLNGTFWSECCDGPRRGGRPGDGSDDGDAAGPGGGGGGGGGGKLLLAEANAAAAAEMLAACRPGNMVWNGCPEPMWGLRPSILCSCWRRWWYKYEW